MMICVNNINWIIIKVFVIDYPCGIWFCNVKICTFPLSPWYKQERNVAFLEYISKISNSSFGRSISRSATISFRSPFNYNFKDIYNYQRDYWMFIGLSPSFRSERNCTAWLKWRILYRDTASDPTIPPNYKILLPVISIIHRKHTSIIYWHANSLWYGKILYLKVTNEKHETSHFPFFIMISR